MMNHHINLMDMSMTGERFPIVKEDDTCRFWESLGDESLAPMHECWYCRYSDFRKDISGHRAFSLCRYPKIKDIGEDKATGK